MESNGMKMEEQKVLSRERGYGIKMEEKNGVNLMSRQI
jgi:hypothetical protein